MQHPMQVPRRSPKRNVPSSDEADLVRQLMEASDIDAVLESMEQDHFKHLAPIVSRLSTFDRRAPPPPQVSPLRSRTEKSLTDMGHANSVSGDRYQSPARSAPQVADLPRAGLVSSSFVKRWDPTNILDDRRSRVDLSKIGSGGRGSAVSSTAVSAPLDGTAPTEDEMFRRRSGTNGAAMMPPTLDSSSSERNQQEMVGTVSPQWTTRHHAPVNILDDVPQSRIARQLQLLRSYRELSELCAKTTSPSKSLFANIETEHLARQQAEQIHSVTGSPVTVNNNYYIQHSLASPLISQQSDYPRASGTRRSPRRTTPTQQPPSRSFYGSQLNCDELGRNGSYRVNSGMHTGSALHTPTYSKECAPRGPCMSPQLSPGRESPDAVPPVTTTSALGAPLRTHAPNSLSRSLRASKSHRSHRTAIGAEDPYSLTATTEEADTSYGKEDDDEQYDHAFMEEDEDQNSYFSVPPRIIEREQHRRNIPDPTVVSARNSSTAHGVLGGAGSGAMVGELVNTVENGDRADNLEPHHSNPGRGVPSGQHGGGVIPRIHVLGTQKTDDLSSSPAVDKDASPSHKERTQSASMPPPRTEDDATLTAGTVASETRGPYIEGDELVETARGTNLEEHGSTLLCKIHRENVSAGNGSPSEESPTAQLLTHKPALSPVDNLGEGTRLESRLLRSSRTRRPTQPKMRTSKSARGRAHPSWSQPTSRRHDSQFAFDLSSNDAYSSSYSYSSTSSHSDYFSPFRQGGQSRRKNTIAPQRTSGYVPRGGSGLGPGAMGAVRGNKGMMLGTRPRMGSLPSPSRTQQSLFSATRHNGTVGISGVQPAPTILKPQSPPKNAATIQKPKGQVGYTSQTPPLSPRRRDMQEPVPRNRSSGLNFGASGSVPMYSMSVAATAATDQRSASARTGPGALPAQGLLYGSLLPTARPATALHGAPLGTHGSGASLMEPDVFPRMPSTTPRPKGDSGEIQQLVWKSGSSGTVAASNRHVPAAPKSKLSSHYVSPSRQRSAALIPKGIAPPPRIPARARAEPPAPLAVSQISPPRYRAQSRDRRRRGGAGEESRRERRGVVGTSHVSDVHSGSAPKNLSAPLSTSIFAGPVEGAHRSGASLHPENKSLSYTQANADRFGIVCLDR